MITTANEWYRWYQKTMSQADPRLKSYPLMSPLLSFSLSLLYVVLVLAGKRFMKPYSAFVLRIPMAVYNFFMVALSAFIVEEFLMSGWLAGYSLGCQGVDYSNSPQALRMVRVCWLFYASKYVEFLDTFFFVLRKKNAQLSFLHIFHHAIMPLPWCCGVNFYAGGMGSFHGMLNSAVHTVMYTYYGLASLGPRYQRYLWWKKYLTVFQMVQFAMCILVHGYQLVFLDCSKHYPSYLMKTIMLYAAMFFLLFANFWYHAYTKKSRDQKSLSTTAEANGVVYDAKTMNGIKKVD